MKKLIGFLFYTVFLAYCTGVAQFATALAKNKAAVVCMMNADEEESKKEKESKEAFDTDKVPHSHAVERAPLLDAAKQYSSAISEQVQHQFILENATPPPDYSS